MSERQVTITIFPYRGEKTAFAEMPGFQFITNDFLRTMYDRKIPAFVVRHLLIEVPIEELRRLETEEFPTPDGVIELFTGIRDNLLAKYIKSVSNVTDADVIRDHGAGEHAHCRTCPVGEECPIYKAKIRLGLHVEENPEPHYKVIELDEIPDRLRGIMQVQDETIEKQGGDDNVEIGVLMRETGEVEATFDKLHEGLPAGTITRRYPAGGGPNESAKPRHNDQKVEVGPVLAFVPDEE